MAKHGVSKRKQAVESRERMLKARTIDDEIRDLREIAPVAHQKSDSLPARYRPSLIKNKLKRQSLVEEMRNRKDRVKREVSKRRHTECKKLGIPLPQPDSIDRNRDVDAGYAVLSTSETAKQEQAFIEKNDEMTTRQEIYGTLLGEIPRESMHRLKAENLTGTIALLKKGVVEKGLPNITAKNMDVKTNPEKARIAQSAFMMCASDSESDEDGENMNQEEENSYQNETNDENIKMKSDNREGENMDCATESKAENNENNENDENNNDTIDNEKLVDMDKDDTPSDENDQAEKTQMPDLAIKHDAYAGKLRVAISTSTRVMAEATMDLVKDLQKVFGGVLEYIPREKYTVKQLMALCIGLRYEGLIIVQENDEIVYRETEAGRRKKRTPSGLMVISLPEGPTAYFSMSSVETHRMLIKQHSTKKGQISTRLIGSPLKNCPPEVLMNNFTTSLGRRVSRLLSSMLSEDENLRARQVITFHNQRDFIFFRAHRYIFEPKYETIEENGESTQKLVDVECRLQELGPRFTLKLRYLQKGLYDLRNGEFEFMYHAKLDSRSRRKFFL